MQVSYKKLKVIHWNNHYEFHICFQARRGDIFILSNLIPSFRKQTTFYYEVPKKDKWENYTTNYILALLVKNN